MALNYPSKPCSRLLFGKPLYGLIQQVQIWQIRRHMSTKRPKARRSRQRQLTPLKQFRPQGIFSVTDLVAPAWFVSLNSYNEKNLIPKFKFKGVKSNLIMDYGGNCSVLSRNDPNPSCHLQGRQFLPRNRLLRRMM